MMLEATIRPTGRFEKFNDLTCRIWEGTTNAGTPIELYVPCVRARTEVEQADLERGLQEIKVERQLVSFDSRML